MLPATSLAPQVFDSTPTQDFVDHNCPTWRTGTCVMRDAAGHVCGALYFTRQDDGGVVIVLTTEGPGVEVGSMDDTKF
jgi:hypothetical protein